MPSLRDLGHIVAMAVIAVAGCADDPAPAAPDARPPPVIDGACEGAPGGPRVLVYTRETTWMHSSNPVARAALLGMCATRGFTVTATADPDAFTAARLAAYDVVVFSQTSGTVLDAAARVDLEAWLRAGGGFVGIHAASGTEWDWPFYLDFLGTRFHTHAPGTWPARVTFEPVDHPITRGLTTWSHTDEWYVFFTRPEDTPGLTMLFALDEGSLDAAYPAETRVGYHPIAWVHERFGGRCFYTAAGHTDESYGDPVFLEILGRAIEWTARR